MIFVSNLKLRVETKCVEVECLLACRISLNQPVVGSLCEYGGRSAFYRYYCVQTYAAMPKKHFVQIPAALVVALPFSNIRYVISKLNAKLRHIFSIHVSQSWTYRFAQLTQERVLEMREYTAIFVKSASHSRQGPIGYQLKPYYGADVILSTF
eukprot:scaffold233367_cov35-Prasinocladus_malaysianus.AAC.1